MFTAPNNSSVIVAHRGASADAPENTIPAFQLAWEQGADAIEGDFHLTADGHIVCIHDYDTIKTTGKKVLVAGATFDELSVLDVGAWFHKSFAGTRMPLLKEVLKIVPAGKQVFIEVKCGPEIIPALVDELDKSDLDPGQVTVISFDAEVIRGLKLKIPQLTANWLTGFKKSVTGRLQPSWEDIMSTLEDIHADGLSSKAHDGLNPADIRTLLDAGYGYHAWTIDDPRKARRFMKMGAQSITTNVPGIMKKALDDELWPSTEMPRGS